MNDLLYIKPVGNIWNQIQAIVLNVIALMPPNLSYFFEAFCYKKYQD